MSAPKRFVRLNADAPLEKTFRELLGKGAKFKVLDAEGNCSEYYDYLAKLYNDGALNIKDYICSIYDTSDYDNFDYYFDKGNYTKAEIFDRFASFCAEDLGYTISAVVIETDMEIYIILIDEDDAIGEFHNVLAELALAVQARDTHNNSTVAIDLGQVFTPQQDADTSIPKMNIPLCDLDNTVQIITQPMFAEL